MRCFVTHVKFREQTHGWQDHFISERFFLSHRALETVGTESVSPIRSVSSAAISLDACLDSLSTLHVTQTNLDNRLFRLFKLLASWPSTYEGLTHITTVCGDCILHTCNSHVYLCGITAKNMIQFKGHLICMWYNGGTICPLLVARKTTP